MKTIDNFKAIKQEILDRARAHHACREQYGRAYAAKNLQELCNVIKYNFDWCCSNKILTTELLEHYKADFAANRIYVNTDITEGYLLATGNITVAAGENSIVMAYNNAKVRAYDNTTVKAYDNTIVKAYYNTIVIAHNNVTVEAHDNASIKVYDDTTVYAFDRSTVTVYSNSKVRAYDNAYCVSYYEIDCQLSGNALHRVVFFNTVYFANNNIKFQKQ